MSRMIPIQMELDDGHDIKAVVLVSYNADEDEWSVGVKRLGDPPESYAWIAERLRTIAFEMEMQGMIDGEEADDTSSGDGE